MSNPTSSAAWNFNGNGNYSDSSKWVPANVPTGAGLTATFGNGVPAGTVAKPPSLTVTVDGAEVVGSLVFNNTNGTGYILGNDGDVTHGITLNNNGSQATVSVSADTLQQIFANLALADNTTFDVSGTSSLQVTVGSIGQTGAARSLTKTGTGTLTIDTPSSYAGGTTVGAGTLTTTATGTLGGGPLAVNGTGGATMVNLGNDQTVSGLSSAVSAGSATLNVAAGTTLTVNQTTSTTFAGAISLAAGGSANSGGSLAMTGNGTLEVQGSPSLGANSNINVSGGKLRFNVASGSAVGAGVLVTVTNAATLELAGSASALSDGAAVHSANISTSSTAAAGLLISGTNQRVGNVDGSGTTQVNDGASLTANHIVQGALDIGVTGSSPSLVTIAASDANGNSLADSSPFVLAGSLAPSVSSASGTLSSSNLLATSGSSLANDSTGSIVGTFGPGGSASAVPEPSTLLLVCLGLAALWFLSRQMRNPKPEMQATVPKRPPPLGHRGADGARPS